jgi:hypothetical protein
LAAADKDEEQPQIEATQWRTTTRTTRSTTQWRTTTRTTRSQTNRLSLPGKYKWWNFWRNVKTPEIWSLKV